MKFYRTALLGVAGAALVAASAMAADPLPVVALPAAVGEVPRCDTAAYVDSYFGAGLGHLFDPAEPDPGIRWRELAFGGAGRAAIQCSPSFSMQLDAWGDHWSGWWDLYAGDEPREDPQPFDRTTMGIGTHLTYEGGGFVAGALVSLGSVAYSSNVSVGQFPGTFANVALEAAFNNPNLGVQGQVGYTRALFGQAADLDAADWYAQAVVAFYPNPNMSLTGTVGFDFYQDTFEWFGRSLNWGAKFEFKPQSQPVSFYLAYHGWHWGAGATTAFDFVYGWEHTIRLGLRFLVGAPTLRELDEAVGLADYNQIYGAAFGPTHFLRPPPPR